jgi:tetratricopeptide (TPR) repeat protein
MKITTTLALVLAGAIVCAPAIQAQQQVVPPGQADGPMTENPQYKQKSSEPKPPDNSAPPRSDNESSSNQTRIDLSPPMGDKLAHPDGGHVADEVMELHEWNPMRAMKDVEVGNYYYDNGKYKAALNRYRDALQYKPRDAVATFKLAQTLEKMKDFTEARARYEEYLAILKDGPSAGEAKKALERLKKQ